MTLEVPFLRRRPWCRLAGRGALTWCPRCHARVKEALLSTESARCLCTLESDQVHASSRSSPSFSSPYFFIPERFSSQKQIGNFFRR